jgi:hypothetical protein
MTSLRCTGGTLDSWCLDSGCSVLADLCVPAKAEESMRPLVYGYALGGAVKGAVVGEQAIEEVVDRFGRADSCGCFR